MGIDFQRYLESICTKYQHWWSLDKLKDTVGWQQADGEKLSSLFDFGLMAQIIERRQQQAEKTERISVLKELRNYAPTESVLLIGRPGAGKSTTLARLLVEAAKEALQNQQNQIPVLVELRYYKDYYDTSVLDLVKAFLKRHKLRLDISTLEDLLNEGRFLLLMDGINELPDNDARTKIKLFRRDNADIPMIFTTRDGGDDLGIEKKLEMQPLSDVEVQRFIDDCMPGQTKEILQQLRDRLRELGQTPLVMWMLYFIFQKTRDVPLSSGEALRKFTQLYERSSKDDVPVTKESRDWWSGLLEHLAFEMMQADKPTDFRLSISERDAEKNFTEFLQGREEYPERLANICFKDLLKHHLIQRNPQNGEIEFCHQLLQEYYAAESLLQRLDQIIDDNLKYYYLNYLKWTEPLSLMLALPEIKDKQAERVVKLALDVDFRLGARLAGEVKREFQEKTVGLVAKLELDQELKIRLLCITRSNITYKHLCQILKDMDNKTYLREMYLNAKGESSGNIILLLNLYKIGSKITAKILPPDINIVQLFKKSIHSNQSSNNYQLEAIEEQDSRWFMKFIESEENIKKSIAFNLFHQQEAVSVRGCFWYYIDSNIINQIGIEIALSLLLRALKEDESSDMRSQAASVLGFIGNKAVIPDLCNSLEDKSSTVYKSAYESLIKIIQPELLNLVSKYLVTISKDTKDLIDGILTKISKIQEKRGYFNHIIATSPPPEEENQSNPLLNTLNKLEKTMSETPKYVFHNPNIGNFADTVQSGGRQQAIQHIQTPEQKQNLAEAAKEIQQLLEQLAKTNPTIVESQNKDIVVTAIHQEIKRNPTIKARLVNALKSGGTEALKQALDAIFKNPLVSISVETIKGFIEAE
ncbi:putative NTPase (NACHT family) [Cylindrospermum stagnale PCC 7417]|uniref:Putative NTPase (NACHT family) n=1 Tax=Cylindrospermum stagnale PCC 7417 TaxID=56107 RepID=K9WSU4_9NOST|nr:HEAT repeat domain-containing protein [Cylindrospermum stagnale]AFZ22856.1 putative NTPase (NACHT family) [Cylindrospermum stagnale PCC 7417]